MGTPPLARFADLCVVCMTLRVKGAPAFIPTLSTTSNLWEPMPKMDGADFKERPEGILCMIALADLKLVYRSLHGHLRSESALLESEFLLGAQSFLQRKAQEEGVDVANHGEWDRWLSAD